MKPYSASDRRKKRHYAGLRGDLHEFVPQAKSWGPSDQMITNADVKEPEAVVFVNGRFKQARAPVYAM